MFDWIKLLAPLGAEDPAEQTSPGEFSFREDSPQIGGAGQGATGTKGGPIRIVDRVDLSFEAYGLLGTV